MKGFFSRLLALGTALFLIVGTFGIVPSAQAVVSNTLIKGSSPAVYWYATNGKRYVFPNLKTYYTWFTSNDFGRVQVISDYELSQIPLGGNVTYRGGAKLVKVTTDPRVYAVSRYGVLRWVTSEYLAAQLYGSNWRWQVEDVPDAFFVNYTVGSPIYSVSDYNVGSEYNGVNTPTDNINNLWVNPVQPLAPYYPNYQNGYPYYGYNYNDGFNSSTYVSGSITNRWMSGSQEAITYTATVSNPNTASSNIFIQILDANTGSEVGRCSAASTCAATLASRETKNVNLYARAVDQRGTAIESSRVSVSYGYNYNSGYYPYYNPSTNFTGSARLTANRTDVNYNEGVTFTTYIDTVSTDISNVTVKIYNAANESSPVATCSAQWSCSTNAVSWSRYDNQTFTVQYYALLSDQYGRTLSRVYSPVITVRPTYVAPPVYPPYVPPAPVAFQVTGVSASVSPSYDTCGSNTYTFTGSISTNGAGTVRYTWERSDGALSPEQTVYFNGAGTQSVTNSWNLNSTYSGWSRLRVLAPNDTTSNMATFSHTNDCLWYY